MPISALDKETARLINTTQVITSVYTVVKELVENALDANAKNIEINLTDNGLTLIEVKDDGTGISKEDIPYTALPSYTSKISNFEDLERLHSYGFRGEALNALCNIAEVMIITKTNQDGTGMMYTLGNNGNIIKSEICHRSVGTTIQVKSLFKEIPIRRRIISDTKKSNEDVKALEWLLHSLGICNPSTRINYRVNNQIVFTKPSLNNIDETISHVFGRKVFSNMKWIKIADGTNKINILVPSKEGPDISNIWQTGLQYIFVNNRPVKHKEIEKIVHKGLSDFFGEKIPSKRKAVFLVYMVLSPADVDVNLEPNKTTVLLKNEKLILDIVEANLKNYYGLREPEKVNEKEDNTLTEDSMTCNNGKDDVDVEDEWPVCKKRKVDSRETTIDMSKEIGNTDVKPIFTKASHKKKVTGKSDEINVLSSDLDELMKSMPAPALSESDSNDIDDFIAVNVRKNNGSSEQSEVECSVTPDITAYQNCAEGDTDEPSQPLVVDLGEDFDIESILNKTEDSNIVDTEPKESKKERENITLEMWSKGHVPGLKGKTAVVTYGPVNTDNKKKRESISSPKDSTFTPFAIFSKSVRSQIVKENPKLTIPQVAHKISDLWKSLSSEERGYYRDLARDQKTQDKLNRSIDASGKSQEEEAELNKKRFLNMLHRMKKVTKNQNLFKKTNMLWDVDRFKVAEAFHRRSVSPTEHDIVIGQLPDDKNKWIVRNSSQLWLLDIEQVKAIMKSLDINTDVVTSKDVERLLKEWFTAKDDASIMSPFYTLIPNRS